MAVAQLWIVRPQVMPSLPIRFVRKRTGYVLCFIIVIALGLASRRYPVLFPAMLGKYPGDALWALMVFLGWGIVSPKSSSFSILAYAVATSYCVECCKLYQAPWIDGVRNTTTGHL